MTALFKILIFIATLCYPVACYYLKDSDSRTLLALLMCLIWLIKAMLDEAVRKKISFGIAIFFAIAVILQQDILLYWYPAILSLTFLIIFASSLFAKQSIIEKLARIKHPHLDENAIRYTRKVTYIWCLFFIFNAVFVVYCIFTNNIQLWALYTGIISYILMGLLFVGEWLVRTFIVKPER